MFVTITPADNGFDVKAIIDSKPVFHRVYEEYGQSLEDALNRAESDMHDLIKDMVADMITQREKRAKEKSDG